MPLRLLALLLVAPACSPGGDGANDPDLPIPDGAAAGCGDHAPVLEELTVVDGGMQDFESGSYPSFIVRADTSDQDSDLHYYEMRVWYDDVVDGVVDTERPYLEAYGTINATACGVPRTTFSLQIAVTGAPPTDTELDIGVIVWDDMENPTNDGVPVVVTYRTPR